MASPKKIKITIAVLVCLAGCLIVKAHSEGNCNLLNLHISLMLHVYERCQL